MGTEAGKALAAARNIGAQASGCIRSYKPPSVYTGCSYISFYLFKVIAIDIKLLV